MTSNLKRIIRDRSPSRKNSKGWTMVELGIAILLVSILIAGVLAYLTSNKRKITINTNSQQLLSIAGTSIAKYGQANQYAAMTTAIAVTGGVIPEELRDPGGATTATNSYGGAIAVAPATLTGANDSLRITWPNVTQSHCSDIVLGVANNFRRVQVQAADVKATDVTVNLANVEAQCQSAANVSIDFFVGRT